MSKRKHFVVVLDWSHKDEWDIEILGVTHLKSAARKILKKQAKKEIKFAKEHNWIIDSNTKDNFMAGEEYSHTTEHAYLWIKEVW